MRAETEAAVEAGRDAPATALEILGIAACETTISRLFGELIEHGGAAGHALLSALVGRPVDPSARLQVRFEQPYDGLGGEPRRIDLVVS